MDLPAGLHHRPLVRTDLRAVFEIMRDSEVAVLGACTIEEEYIAADWARPSFDLTASTVGVFDGDRLVGYAEVSGPGRGDAVVDPADLGRGIGTALARWMQSTAAAQGQAEIGMAVPLGSPGDALLRSLGYTERWLSWLLGFPLGREIPEQVLPEGYTLRPASEADLEASYHVVEDAFGEWVGRAKITFEDWTAGVTGMDGFEPWNLLVVTDPAGAVVGAVHTTLFDECGFVDKVAVRHDQRGRGLGRALLAAAFGEARAHGATKSELSTDSRTGALDLYLGLGMEIESTWPNLGIAV